MVKGSTQNSHKSFTFVAGLNYLIFWEGPLLIFSSQIHFLPRAENTGGLKGGGCAPYWEGP